ncbi:Hypothetical predicted protein [Podarcis lilfordi]|uniref:Uncharacterized protein n=1 Tax=Podarcis lilfordi TaxID=74358 RepID=A0AA35LGU5_9SAUR|nr:Hypothetical predicted protein [Podarcis lilfordi]
MGHIFLIFFPGTKAFMWVAGSSPLSNKVFALKKLGFQCKLRAASHTVLRLRYHFQSIGGMPVLKGTCAHYFQLGGFNIGANVKLLPISFVNIFNSVFKISPFSAVLFLHILEEEERHFSSAPSCIIKQPDQIVAGDTMTSGLV